MAKLCYYRIIIMNSDIKLTDFLKNIPHFEKKAKTLNEQFIGNIGGSIRHILRPYLYAGVTMYVLLLFLLAITIYYVKK